MKRTTATLILAVLTGGVPTASRPQSAAAPEPAAQAPRPVQNRVVPMGERRLIAFYSSLFPDCSSQGSFVIRITEQPKRGTLSFVNEQSFPNYPPSHPLSSCGTKKVEGTKIFYEASDPDYSGLDEFGVFIITPTATGFDERFRVSIR